MALLRGINVGGRKRLPMADLVTVFTEAGCGAVKTYIQSGNVLFEATPALAGGLPAVVTRRIEARMGLRVPVVVRSAVELARTVHSNPFLDAGEDPSALHVMFLADRPTADAVAKLDPNRSPPDQFVVVGRDVYFRCPNGVARTKLTNDYFERALATVSTGRNWRTTTKLLELLQS